jgi:hypothetical protein
MPCARLRTNAARGWLVVTHNVLTAATKSGVAGEMDAPFSRSLPDTGV